MNPLEPLYEVPGHANEDPDYVYPLGPPKSAPACATRQKLVQATGDDGSLQQGTPRQPVFAGTPRPLLCTVQTPRYRSKYVDLNTDGMRDAW